MSKLLAGRGFVGEKFSLGLNTMSASVIQAAKSQRALPAQVYVNGGAPLERETEATWVNAIAPVGNLTDDEGTNETTFTQSWGLGSVKLLFGP
jgi:hypothetical protein